LAHPSSEGSRNLEKEKLARKKVKKPQTPFLDPEEGPINAWKGKGEVKDGSKGQPGWFWVRRTDAGEKNLDYSLG